MTEPIKSPPLKGLLWSDIPNGSYWVAPVHEKVFDAKPHPVMCQIFGEPGDRWIEYEGGVAGFNDTWDEFVFVPCERPRMEDIDFSAGLAVLEGLRG